MKKFTFIFLFLCLISSISAREYVLIAYDIIVKKGNDLNWIFLSDGFNIERPVQKSMAKPFN